MSELSLPDKIAMVLGGGLLVLGTVVIGFVEMLVGSSHPVTGEGQIVHEAVVQLEIRSYIIIAGLLVWGLYVVYRVVGTTPNPAETQRQAADPEQTD